MAGREAQHIHIIVALTVDADDLLRCFLLDRGDFLKIGGIFSLVADGNLSDKTGDGILGKRLCGL